MKTYSLNKTLFTSIVCSKCGNNNNRIFMKEGSNEILKILELMNKTKLTFMVLNV